MKMETNRYDYNTTVQWTPQKNQFYEGGHVTPQARQQKLPRPQNPRTPQSAAGQQPRAPENMPKARAPAPAHTLKKWLGAASSRGFGTVSRVGGLHPGGTHARQSTRTS